MLKTEKVGSTYSFPISCHIAYSIAMTKLKHGTDFELTKYTTYRQAIWGVCIMSALKKIEYVIIAVLILYKLMVDIIIMRGDGTALRILHSKSPSSVHWVHSESIVLWRNDLYYFFNFFLVKRILSICNVACHQTVIGGATVLVPFHVVKSATPVKIRHTPR